MLDISTTCLASETRDGLLGCFLLSGDEQLNAYEAARGPVGHDLSFSSDCNAKQANLCYQQQWYNSTAGL